MSCESSFSGRDYSSSDHRMVASADARLPHDVRAHDLSPRQPAYPQLEENDLLASDTS